jgi:uncharacterized LabA/DUF88 family protein
MPACVYIDGFSLYHQCFRRTADRNHLKWLDLRALAAAILPDEDIAVVRYYTARVADTPEDPQRASRQDAFLRALATRPNLVIRQGQFSRSKREGRLVHPPDGIDPRQTTWIMQEKRSDVSLATDLLVDAFDGRAEVALLITNDSDFEMPIKMVTERFGVRVVVISPDVMVSKRLARLAAHARPLDHRLLENCQLPDVVVDIEGREIRRPAAWTRPAQPLGGHM